MREDNTVTHVRALRQKRYRRACWWLDQGIEVVPLKPQSKELQPGYGSRKAHITDVTFARRWFLNTNANLGVVLGGDAGLAVADWDDVQDYEAWRDTAGAMVHSLTEQTARGYHVFFAGEGLTSAVGQGCELKTGGVCTVSPSVHPSGVVYRVTNTSPIALLDEERACQVFPFLSEVRDKKGHPSIKGSFGERSALEKQKRVVPEGKGVIARIKAVRSAVDEMIFAGIKLRSGGENALVGLCPFHDDHHPSLWVNPENGLWGCNKPGCPAAGVHDAINFRALARGISNAEAIKQLAREFL